MPLLKRIILMWFISRGNLGFLTGGKFEPGRLSRRIRETRNHYLLPGFLHTVAIGKNVDFRVLLQPT